jgi:putative ATP-binding cassette transporter
MKYTSFKLFKFLLNNSRGTVVLTSIVGIISGVSGAIMMAQITMRLVQPGVPGTEAAVRFGVLVLLVLFSAIVSGLLSTYLAQRTGYNLRLNLCRQILSTPLRHVEEAGSHKVVAALTQDVPVITGAFLRVPQVCTCAAIVLGSLTYLAWLSWEILLGLVVFLSISVASYVLPANKASRYLRRGREEWDALIKHFRALTEGAKELKLHRRRSRAFFDETLVGTAKSMRHNNAVGANVFVVLNSWTQMLYFLVIGIILFILPRMSAELDARVLTGYAITVLYMSGPLMTLVGVIPTFRNAAISLEKVEQLGVTLSATDVSDGGRRMQDKAVSSWERLELVGITHSYYREHEAGNFVLGPISLKLVPGEVVFLIGGNGSGKTTLAKLITGLYIPEGGQIRLNGRLVDEYNRDHLRQHFSVVFSDFFLFEQFLGLEGPDLDEQARAYVERLQLENKVKVEGGRLSTTELSQGQRKRLALLTAYLEDRPIYIFDEWAADQDPLFKEVFYFQILPELKARGKTVVVISHDDRYYHVGDRLIKLDYGRLVSDRYVAGALDEPPAAEPEISLLPG